MGIWKTEQVSELAKKLFCVPRKENELAESKTQNLNDTFQDFVWAADSSEYAVRENASTVKIFKNFKEKKTFRPDFGAEAIFGGMFLNFFKYF